MRKILSTHQKMAESSEELGEPHPEDDSDLPHSEAIRDVYDTLRSKLEALNLIGILYQDRIITDTEMDRIKAATVVYDRNDELLAAVRRRSGSDILRFCQILLREQRHCGNVLKGALHKRKVDIKDLEVPSPNPPTLNHTRPKFSPIQRRLRDHYIRFLRTVRKACVGESFEDIKLICGQLLRDKVQELPLGYLELKQKIESNLERLRNSMTSNDLLDCLVSHSDYINCELVHQFVTQMDNNEMNKAWMTYGEELQKACQLTLDQWSRSEVSGSQDSGTLPLGFQTKLTPDSLPVDRVLELQGFLCYALEMKETEFAGYASSTVTLFFTVCTSRLPFLLFALSRHRKTLEDLSVEFAFVPGEFIYSIALDQDYEFLQEPTEVERQLALATFSKQLKFHGEHFSTVLQDVQTQIEGVHKYVQKFAVEGERLASKHHEESTLPIMPQVVVTEPAQGSAARLDKMSIAFEEMQTRHMAMLTKQESSAEEKRKLHEQIASLKKSLFEALMDKDRITSKLGGELLKSSFDKAAEHFKVTVEKHHEQFKAELKQLQEAKSVWHAELLELLEKEAQKESSQLEVPAKMAGTLIGVKGQNFRRIESKTGVMRLRLVPGPSEDVSIVNIFGTENSRKAAKKELRICVATLEQVKEKKICFLTVAQDDSTLSFAEYKGILPASLKPERRFRKFYCLKLTRADPEKKTGDLPAPRATLIPWNSLRNSDRLTARFLCAIEEALMPGPVHLELEARFGSIFFRAGRPLQSHELKEVYPIGSLEKDAYVDTSNVLDNTYWNFVAILPKTLEAVKASDVGMVFIGEPELVNVTLTYIPEEADCVQYVLHACRGKDGKFHALNVQPKVVKALMFDCLPLHGNLDVRFAFSSTAVRAGEEQRMMNELARKMASGLEVANGIVKISKESLKEVEVDFRISFIRYERKKMYLIKSEGSFFILAHFSVEECDTVHQGIADEAEEFPLRDRDKHYELELKNCQWLADFYHLVGSNWKEQLSAQGCDVSQIGVVPKPVHPVTVVQELEHFAKYALQVTPAQEE